MKSKMSQIGIGLAALSAFAAEGKDFNREEHRNRGASAADLI